MNEEKELGSVDKVEPESAQNFFQWAEIEKDGEWIEHNILRYCEGKYTRTETAFYSIYDALIECAKAYDRTISLQVVGANPRPVGLKESAKDADIQIWKSLYLDIEPIHPAGTNVTEEEKTNARYFINNSLEQTLLEWGGTIADSGNGWHIWIAFPPILGQEAIQDFKLRLNTWYKQLLQNTQELRQEYNVRIDHTFSPSRQVKLYGTKKPIQGSRIATFPRVERRESTAFVDFIRTFRPQTSTNQYVESSLRCDDSLAEIEEKYGLRD